MKERIVFEKYQGRLINLSGRSPSLMLNHLYMKRHFDLVSLFAHFPDVYHSLISDFLLGEEDSLCLLPSLPMGDEPLQANLAHQQLAHQLYTLYRTLEAQFKESGQYPLRIAIYFAEGLFKDGTKCRAPLGLMSVKLSLKEDAFYLSKVDDKGLDTNDVLLHALVKCHQARPTEFDLILKNTQYLLPNLLDHYAQNGAPLHIDAHTVPVPDTLWEQDWFTPFDPLSAQAYDALAPGHLAMRPYLILGTFPTANAIYEDYQTLIDQDLSSHAISRLFGTQEDPDFGPDFDPNFDPGKVDSANISAANISTANPLYTLSPLDTSQENALRKAIHHQNLVIFGPPGTGKSQCITNAISHFLASGQRVLVVSQKKAALNVIYNRLGPLQSKSLLLHDVVLGKKAFYEKIAQNLITLEATYGETFHYKNRTQIVVPEGLEAHAAALTALAKSIQDQLNTLDDFYRFLKKPQLAGYSGQSLFTKALSPLQQADHGPWLSSLKALLEAPELASLSRSDFDQLHRIDWSEQLSNQQKIDALLGAHPLLSKFSSSFNPTNPDFNPANPDSTPPLIQAFDLAHLAFHRQHQAYPQNQRMPSSFSVLEHNQQNSQHLDAALKATYGDLLVPVSKGLKRLWRLVFNKKTLLLEEQSNRELYESHSKSYHRWLGETLKCQQVLIQSCQSLSAVFTQKYLKELGLEASKNRSLAKPFNLSPIVFSHALSVLPNYRQHLAAAQCVVGPARRLVQRVATWQELPTLAMLESLFCSHLLMGQQSKLSTYGDLLLNYQILVEEHGDLLDTLQTDFSAYRNLVAKSLNMQWDARFLRTSKSHDYRELERISSLKRKLRTVRESFSAHEELLLDLFPCMLMGPETVSQVLPLVGDLFDVIIFDEASQLLIEEAIPAIYRAKCVIVAGDDKQLGPNRAFKALSSAYDNEEGDEDDGDGDDGAWGNGDSWEEEATDLNLPLALGEESLLDLAKKTYNSTMLLYHYRSRHEALIQFSNRAFYQGQLKTVPSPSATAEHPPISRILVEDGIWEQQANQVEAKAVVALVEDLLKAPQTCGIITFSQSQKDAIEDALEERMLQSPEFSSRLMAEMERVEGLEDVSLFVKNIENVQGDERDVIIFSTGYAKNAKGKLNSRFGTLNQLGGENRLNVAISRAKEKIYLVTSFEPEALQVERSKHLGPILFKKYLEYARSVSQGELAPSLSSDYNVNGSLVVDSKLNCATDHAADHATFVKVVYHALIARGFSVKQSVGTSDFRIDLAIVDPLTLEVKLGILCDCAPIIGEHVAKENDLDRLGQLVLRGWPIYRVWSLSWWQNAEVVIRAIENSVTTRG